MKPTVWIALIGLACAGGARAGIEVVGDGACPYYAVDIESFATCDGEQVTRAAAEAAADALKDAPAASAPPRATAQARQHAKKPAAASPAQRRPAVGAERGGAR